MRRCQWAEDKPDFYQAYHDYVWGKPVHDDRQLFKWLLLETFHVGLSWQLVLSKEANFAKAFADYDYQVIANWTQEDVDRVLMDPGIIRHRGKVQAAPVNARAFLKVQEEFTTFDQYIWHYTKGKVIHGLDDLSIRATSSPLSDRVTHDLKRRGFKYIGTVTIHAYLQAIGIFHHHERACDFRMD